MSAPPEGPSTAGSMDSTACVFGTVPIDAMVGDDAEETAALRALLEIARAYVGGASDLPPVLEERYGLGVGEVVAVFLFRFAPSEGFPERIWVIADEYAPGHVPLEQAETPLAALEVYADGLEQWIAGAREALAGSTSALAQAVAQGAVPITPEWIDVFDRRVLYLRDGVIPFFTDDE